MDCFLPLLDPAGRRNWWTMGGFYNYFWMNYGGGLGGRVLCGFYFPFW